MSAAVPPDLRTWAGVFAQSPRQGPSAFSLHRCGPTAIPPSCAPVLRPGGLIQWTLWGKLAENAATYLGRGSHVNIVGRLRNNHYDTDGEIVYAMTLTVEEIDYLDSCLTETCHRRQTALSR
jgi:hypothetical protein